MTVQMTFSDSSGLCLSDVLHYFPHRHIHELLACDVSF